MGLQRSDIELPAAFGWSPDAKDRIVTILSELGQSNSSLNASTPDASSYDRVPLT
jgi:hypothetical protein